MNLECPKCNALNDVSNVNKYELVKCYNCGSMLEFNGEELLDVANDEDLEEFLP